MVARFGAAGVMADEIAFARETYVFIFAGTSAAFVAAFRNFCGPTMNAFETAEKNGRAGS